MVLLPTYRGGEKMKISKTNREEIRENSLTIPMSKQEKESVKKSADDMGVSMSAFARIVLKDFMKNGMI